MKHIFQKHAIYNQLMNQKLIDAIDNLGEDKITNSQNGFFDSIALTLNHLMVGDLIWLRRFSTLKNFQSLQSLTDYPTPTTLDAQLYPTIESFITARKHLDTVLLEFIEECTAEDFSSLLRYKNTKGIEFNRVFGELVSHLFNHQTHHRGQISTMLYQQGYDIGETDLLQVL